MKMELNSFKYKLAKLRIIWETGYALTHYIKYIVAFVGISTLNLKLTMILALLYIPTALFMGWAWMKWFYLAEIEVSNQYNLFVKEMRKTYKDKK